MFIKVKDHLIDISQVTYIRKMESKERKFYIAVSTSIKDKTGTNVEFWLEHPSVQSRDSEWERLALELQKLG